MFGKHTKWSINFRVVIMLAGSLLIKARFTRSSQSEVDEIVQPLVDSGEWVSVVVGVLNRNGTKTFSYGETVLDSDVKRAR